MTKGWVLGLILLWCSTLGVFADGKVFPPTAYPVPDIPEQQALIHYANGTEKLVIQTSFTGEGTNFAWIVPLPSVPQIEPATSGLFPTLQYQFRPEVKHNVPAWFGGFLALYAFIRLLWKTRAGGSTTAADWLSSIAFGCGLGLMFDSPFTMVFLTMATLYAVDRVRQGKEGPLAIAIMALLIFIMGGMLLPALSTAGVSITSANSVTVHNRQTVGSYETVVISAQKADELMDWLKSNGFAAPPEIAPIVADYIKDGWVFAAARLARTESKGGTAIHPLMFTFPTQKPVYPMRLTGVGNGNLKVDLYIFGDKRAKAQHFTVSRCAQITFPSEDRSLRDKVELIYLGHPGLSNIVAQAAVATKLQATLSPNQMRQDVWLAWEPFRSHQQIFYSYKGAWMTAMNWLTPVIILGLLFQDFRRFQEKLGPLNLRRIRWSLFLASGLGMALLPLLLPQVPVRLTRRPNMNAENTHTTLQYLLAKKLTETSTIDVKSWLEANLEEEMKSIELDTELNPFTGEHYKQEDSPGNFRLLTRTNGFDYLWYDRNGFEHKITYPEPSSPK